MRPAVSSYSLFSYQKAKNASLSTLVRTIAALGAEAIEFVDLNERHRIESVRHARTLRKLCESIGLTPAGYCVRAELLVDASEQSKQETALRKHVEIAAELGVRSMRHDVTRGPGAGARRSDASVFKVVAPAVARVAEFGASMGVRTSAENHGFWLQTADRMLSLLRHVDHPNFGLTLDVGNFLCLNQDSLDAVKRLARHAVMVHAKDFHVRRKSTLPRSGWFATPTPIGLRGAILGHGALDLPAIFKALRASKYDGFVSLEFEGMEDALLGTTLGLEHLRTLIDAPAK